MVVAMVVWYVVVAESTMEVSGITVVPGKTSRNTGPIFT